MNASPTAPVTSLLVVDDEEPILRSLGWTLEAIPELQVTTCNHPRQAISLLKTRRYGLLLTDERMPDLPGHQLIKHCRQLSPGTISMVMSGYSDSERMVNALLSGGMHRFLAKPWHPEQLIEVVKQALGVYRYQQSRRQQTTDLLDQHTKTLVSSTSLQSRLQATQALQTAANPLGRQSQLFDLNQPYDCQALTAYLQQLSPAQALLNERIAELCQWLGPKFALSAPEQQLLRKAALLYNIGGQTLPFTLTTQLRAKQQGLLGEHRRLLKHYFSLLNTVTLVELATDGEDVANILLAQNEYYDGSGGPFQLAGRLIPLPSRVLAASVAFVNAYDKTLYLSGHSSLQQTYQLIAQQGGKQFDPAIVNTLASYSDQDWLG